MRDHCSYRVIERKEKKISGRVSLSIIKFQKANYCETTSHGLPFVERKIIKSHNTRGGPQLRHDHFVDLGSIIGL